MAAPMIRKTSSLKINSRSWAFITYYRPLGLTANGREWTLIFLVLARRIHGRFAVPKVMRNPTGKTRYAPSFNINSRLLAFIRGCLPRSRRQQPSGRTFDPDSEVQSADPRPPNRPIVNILQRRRLHDKALMRPSAGLPSILGCAPSPVCRRTVRTYYSSSELTANEREYTRMGEEVKINNE